MKLISWNVNGLRAVEKKGFLEWLKDTGADIISIQEVKAREEQLSEEMRNIEGYSLYLTCAEKKGYSGVACFVKEKPLSVREGLFDDTYNTEGRVLVLEYPDFFLYNVYFPNGGGGPERRAYKNAFNYALLEEVKKLEDEGKNIIICGDVNIAHEEIDLKNPKANAKTSGFLPEERRYLDDLLAAGFVDSFRELHPERSAYSWWSYRFNARSLDAGWRIDYFFISASLLPFVTGAEIDPTVLGSDHAPISLTLDL